MLLPVVTIIVVIVNTGLCAQKQKVLLLSFAGFRPDYIEAYDLIGFHYLAKTGVHSKLGMKPSFPTETIPNLYTIATGLYSESHGVLSNIMWDPVYNETFLWYGTRDSKWWEGGEPIWITAKRQGKKTSVYSWPGSFTKIHGIYADMVLQRLFNTPLKDEIDTFVDWFGEGDVDLIVANIANSYYMAKYRGSHNERLRQKIQKTDTIIDYLMYRLATEALIDSVNVIVVSEHGLINVTQDGDHVINLSNYIKVKDEITIFRGYRTFSGGSVGLWPKPGREAFVYNKLLHAHSKLKVYTKQNIPDDFHVKNSRRCPPLWIIAEEGYVIKMQASGQQKGIIGVDGYSPGLIDNNAIFYASGPSFKQNYTINELESVNIYPLICRILGIEPAPNNGSLKVVNELLEDVPRKRISLSCAMSMVISLKLLILANTVCISAGLILNE